MTSNDQTVTPETLDSDTAAVTKAEQDNAGSGQGCGRHHACGKEGHARCDWKNKRRFKIIGAVVLITLFGFMLGCGSAHHQGYHMEGRHGYQQMESFGRGGNPPSLSTILDGIGASAEQRSKAVELFQR